MMRGCVCVAAGVVVSMGAVVTAAMAWPSAQSFYITARSQQRPATADVKADNFSFAPALLTVSVGTIVTWTNRDDIPHTVVSTDSVFKSKVLDTGEKFSYTFSRPGSYSYACSIHPKMTGTVVVR
jgi:plastocyanin